MIIHHESTNYEWDFGDGTLSNMPTVAHEYQASGEYVITLHKSHYFTMSGTYCKKSTHSK